MTIMVEVFTLDLAIEFKMEMVLIVTKKIFITVEMKMNNMDLKDLINDIVNMIVEFKTRDHITKWIAIMKDIKMIPLKGKYL